MELYFVLFSSCSLLVLEIVMSFDLVSFDFPNSFISSGSLFVDFKAFLHT